MTAQILKFPGRYRPPPPDYPPLPDALPWDDPAWLRLRLREALLDAQALLDALAEREAGQ